MGTQEKRLEPARWNRRPLKHLSPAAERRQGDRRRARLGLILVVVVFLVAGMVLYARLAALRAATTPVAADRHAD